MGVAGRASLTTCSLPTQVDAPSLRETGTPLIRIPSPSLLPPQGGGAVIGPYALGIIQDVESIRHLAELGVVRACAVVALLHLPVGLLLFVQLASSKMCFWHLAELGMVRASVVVPAALVPCWDTWLRSHNEHIY